MNNEQKWAVVVNILALVPAVTKGISGAISLYDRLLKALEDGISPDELATAVAERKAIMAELIAKTEGEQG